MSCNHLFFAGSDRNSIGCESGEGGQQTAARLVLPKPTGYST